MTVRQLLAEGGLREDRPGGLDATALRTASVAMRDIFAIKATGHAWTFSRLRAWAHSRDIGFRRPPEGVPTLDAQWLMRLARVVALQNLLPDDHETALRLYHLAHDMVDVSSGGDAHAKLYCDLMLRAHQDVMLSAILADLALSPSEESLVRADLENPHRAGPLAKPEPLWRSRFRDAASFPSDARFATTHGGDRPFNLLTARVPSRTARATTLVTVIMNVFRPDNALRNAVESQLRQTWQDIEVLVVDDGSGPEFGEVFREVAALDERVQLIQLPRNRGAYGARNVAMDRARGTYVTFQDYDDWSLPQRLEQQVEVLESDPGLVATRARTTKLHEDLTFAYPGYRPDQIHAASLMFRRKEVMLGIGYFDSVRKAADNEFHERIIAHFGRDASLDVPRSSPSLLAYRRTEGSLSRDEFRPGWRHPDRLAYRHAYQYWHRSVPRHELFIDADSPRRFPAPVRFLSDPPPVGTLDVVIVADWRPSAPASALAADVARWIEDAGPRVGLYHLESPAVLERTESGVVESAQQLLHEGNAVMVQADTELHARLVVVVDAAVLQFVDRHPTAWTTESVWIVNVAKSQDGLLPTHVEDDRRTTASVLFGVAPLWVEDEFDLRLKHRVAAAVAAAGR